LTSEGNSTLLEGTHFFLPFLDNLLQSWDIWGIKLLW
jgi:hypothetical protein